MGQKVNPIAFRMGVTEGWRSRWYAGKKNYGDWLVEDFKIRQLVRKEYGFAGIARIDLEGIRAKIRISLWAARPGRVRDGDPEQGNDRREVLGLQGRKVRREEEAAGPGVGAAVIREKLPC